MELRDGVRNIIGLHTANDDAADRSTDAILALVGAEYRPLLVQAREALASANNWAQMFSAGATIHESQELACWNDTRLAEAARRYGQEKKV